MAANAMDERAKLLTRVCESRRFSSMPTEELKLYLLLLVSAVRIGEEGQIAWEILKRGLGESLTAEQIARLAQALSRHGLARMRVIYPSDAGEHQQRDVTPVVYFTVFELKRLGDPESRSPRRRRAKGDG